MEGSWEWRSECMVLCVFVCAHVYVCVCVSVCVCEIAAGGTGKPGAATTDPNTHRALSQLLAPPPALRLCFVSCLAA